MTQTDAINQAAKRAERYWYEDGLWEIGFGLVNLMLGGFYLVVSGVNWVGPLALVLAVLQAGVIIGAFVIINKLVGYLKQRITYPRTGFVAYRKSSTRTRYKRGVLAGLLAALLAVLVTLFSSLQSGENRMAFVVSIVMAGMLLYIGYRFSLARLYAVSVLTIGLGYAITAARVPDPINSAAFFGGLGVVILVSGLLTLVLYLRRTRPAGEEFYYEAQEYPSPDDPSQNEAQR